MSNTDINSSSHEEANCTDTKKSQPLILRIVMYIINTPRRFMIQRKGLPAAMKRITKSDTERLEKRVLARKQREAALVGEEVNVS